jgi:hypothetical protein
MRLWFHQRDDGETAEFDVVNCEHQPGVRGEVIFSSSLKS